MEIETMKTKEYTADARDTASKQIHYAFQAHAYSEYRDFALEVFDSSIGDA